MYQTREKWKVRVTLQRSRELEISSFPPILWTQFLICPGKTQLERQRKLKNSHCAQTRTSLAGRKGWMEFRTPEGALLTTAGAHREHPDPHRVPRRGRVWGPAQPQCPWELPGIHWELCKATKSSLRGNRETIMDSRKQGLLLYELIHAYGSRGQSGRIHTHVRCAGC